jgi:hypothetical protein
MPTENTQAIAAALRWAIIRLGKIPKTAYIDNGKAFGAKFFEGKNLEMDGFNGLFDRLGMAPHASGVAYFVVERPGRNNVLRWVYDTDLDAVSGPTAYEMTGGSVMVKARMLVGSSGAYHVPFAFTGGTNGYAAINSAHNGQSTVIADLWTDLNVPVRAHVATNPGGSPVAGTAVEEGWAEVSHLIGNGSLFWFEVVGPALPDI